MVGFPILGHFEHEEDTIIRGVGTAYSSSSRHDQEIGFGPRDDVVEAPALAMVVVARERSRSMT